MSVDVLVVGAGFAGAVMAERAAREHGLRVLLVEARPHVAGNAYDRQDEHGVLVHQYGPHIFHTNAEPVFRYLSEFTAWRPYEHRVRGVIDGKEVPLPFNLDSLHQLLPASLAASLERKLLAAYAEGAKVPVLELRRSPDPELQQLGELVYERVFLEYTKKQWGLLPEDLDPSVTTRVPIRVSRDDRYFTDKFQAMPRDGYTPMFERILHHPNIALSLGTDVHEVARFDLDSGVIHLDGEPFRGAVVYTGMLDALFGYELGELPYRSLEFDLRTLDAARVQSVGTVNYPTAEPAYTRSTEFKHLTGQEHAKTTVAYELPMPFQRGAARGNIPYYPIPRPTNRALHERYLERARRFPQLVPVGRLADYQYFDMDQATARALMMSKQLPAVIDRVR
jgi:UDP-galactopyranose mutase